LGYVFLVTSPKVGVGVSMGDFGRYLRGFCFIHWVLSACGSEFCVFTWRYKGIFMYWVGYCGIFVLGDHDLFSVG